MSDLRKSRLLIPAVVLALAGCSAPPVPAEPHRTAHVAPRPHAPAPRPVANPGAVAVVTIPNQTFPDSAVAPPHAVPIHLVGLPQSEVRELLGPPTISLTKGASTSWTYQRADCSVEIAFYYDVTRSDFFALNQRLSRGGDEQDCLSHIHDNHVS